MKKDDRDRCIEYAEENGINLLPLIGGEKRAKKKWRKYQAVRLEEEEKRRLREDKSVNVGFVCGKISGNLFVIDFDSEEMYKKFFREEPDTGIVKTPRGYHVYFRSSKSIQTFHIKDHEGKEVISVKGEGSYVVAPSSYRYIDGEKVSYYFVKKLQPYELVGDPKQDIIEKAEELGLKAVSEIVDIDNLLLGVAEGYRNEAAIRVATWYRRRGLNKDDASKELKEWNKRNIPPLPEEELESCLKHAYAREYPYKYRYTVKPEKKEKKGVKEIIEWQQVAEDLLSKYHWICLSDTEELFVYKDGYYVRGETVAKQEAKEILKEKTSEHYLKEILTYLKVSSYIDRSEVDKDPYIVNVKNGLVDIRTGELMPHTPSHIFFSQLPVVYDPNIDTDNSKCDKFFREVVDEKNVQLLYEIFGYCLLRAYPLHKAFMFVGSGANGKSTVLELLTRFLGEESVSHISLQDFDGSRFSSAALFGKLANIYADIPSYPMKYTGRFKMITGGDTIYGEKKFRDFFSFKNTAKLIFSANTLPEVNDMSYAFWRRWIILEFPNRFEGERCDPNILDKIATPEELSKLLTKSIEALREVLRRNSFSETLSTEKLMNEWRERANSVFGFVSKFLVQSQNSMEEKADVYNQYVKYCKDNDLIPVEYNVFGSSLPKFIRVKSGKVRRRSGRVTVWQGIKLRTIEREILKIVDEVSKVDQRGVMIDILIKRINDWEPEEVKEEVERLIEEGELLVNRDENGNVFVVRG